MEETNKGGNKKVYIAVIILLLLINGAALYLLWSENKAKTDLTTQNVQLEQEFKSLSDTLDAKRLEIDALIADGNIKDSTILAQRDELEAQQKEIQKMLASGKMTKNELAKAKKLIAQYEASIAELQKKVEELTAKNQELINENTKLSNDLSSEKQTTANLTQDLAIKNKKVELGSLLQPKNLTLEAIKKKNNGKEVTVNRIKAAESLRVTFETGENKVLEPGNLSLYIRIINPKGETITVADQGSGSFNLAEGGQTVQFTKKADLEWNQTNKKVVVYWSQNIKDAGTYKVEIYQSGYLIGKGEVVLK
jgi:myosin heavy subunit